MTRNKKVLTVGDSIEWTVKNKPKTPRKNRIKIIFNINLSLFKNRKK